MPFTVSVAVDAETVAVPSVVLPTVKVTVPVGAEVPLAGFTVAVSTVLAEEEKLGGLAVTLVVVAEEPEKLAVAAQVAVIVFAPVTRPDPLHSQSALHR